MLIQIQSKVNFTGNLDEAGGATMFFIIEETKLKTGLPLMKRLLTPLAISALLLLGLSAGMSAADAAIQKQKHGSGTTGLIISNEEREDIIKIVKSLKNQDN